MPKEPSRRSPPSECPVCGATVPRSARACPECGADEKSGWNEESTVHDGLDLPDESFDYEETLKEQGLRRRHKPKGVSGLWWLVGIGVLVALIYLALRGRF